jgi:hypothetical protein
LAKSVNARSASIDGKLVAAALRGADGDSDELIAVYATDNLDEPARRLTLPAQESRNERLAFDGAGNLWVLRADRLFCFQAGSDTRQELSMAAILKSGTHPTRGHIAGHPTDAGVIITWNGNVDPRFVRFE